jgi:Cys-tRNA synthase (O-phospho-L-seryl-tRNA:Cys-tRNA synthase)
LGGGWHGAIHFQKCFADTINKAGFSLIVSGHYHKYKFFEASDIIKVPNIVNSAREMMNVKVNEKEITLSFVGEDGKKSRADVIVPVVK